METKPTDIYATRRANLGRLITGMFGGNRASFARAVGKDPNQVRGWLNVESTAFRNITEDTARAIEQRLALPVGKLYTPHAAEWDKNDIAHSHDVVLSDDPVSQAGLEFKEVRHFGEIGVLGIIPTQDDAYVLHPTQDATAYAATVRGDGLHPRYRSGEVVIITPGATPEPGDDVLVTLLDGRSMIRLLSLISDRDVQFVGVCELGTPLTIPRSEIQAIHVIGGRLPRKTPIIPR